MELFGPFLEADQETGHRVGVLEGWIWWVEVAAEAVEGCIEANFCQVEGSCHASPDLAGVAAGCMHVHGDEEVVEDVFCSFLRVDFLAFQTMTGKLKFGVVVGI